MTVKKMKDIKKILSLKKEASEIDFVVEVSF